jgi:hypothetical protein
METQFNYWFNNEWNIIALKDGESKRLHTEYDTDEGYSCTDVKFTLKDDIVYQERSDTGSDCDGGYGHYDDYVCNVKYMSSVTVVSDGTKIPAWERVKSSNYDQYAEAAGY